MNETGHGFWTKDIEYYVMPIIRINFLLGNTHKINS